MTAEFPATLWRKDSDNMRSKTSQLSVLILGGPRLDAVAVLIPKDHQKAKIWWQGDLYFFLCRYPVKNFRGPKLFVPKGSIKTSENVLKEKVFSYPSSIVVRISERPVVQKLNVTTVRSTIADRRYNRGVRNTGRIFLEKNASMMNSIFLG